MSVTLPPGGTRGVEVPRFARPFMKARMGLRHLDLGMLEREAAWKRVVSLAPRYGKYEETTDRQMPIIRLTPVS